MALVVWEHIYHKRAKLIKVEYAWLNMVGNLLIVENDEISKPAPDFHLPFMYLLDSSSSPIITTKKILSHTISSSHNILKADHRY